MIYQNYLSLLGRIQYSFYGSMAKDISVPFYEYSGILNTGGCTCLKYEHFGSQITFFYHEIAYNNKGIF